MCAWLGVTSRRWCRTMSGVKVNLQALEGNTAARAKRVRCEQRTLERVLNPFLDTTRLTAQMPNNGAPPTFNTTCYFGRTSVRSGIHETLVRSTRPYQEFSTVGASSVT